MEIVAEFKIRTHSSGKYKYSSLEYTFASFHIHTDFERVALPANPSKLFIPMVSGFDDSVWRGWVRDWSVGSKTKWAPRPWALSSELWHSSIVSPLTIHTFRTFWSKASASLERLWRTETLEGDDGFLTNLVPAHVWNFYPGLGITPASTNVCQ
jgi:hypothetical protein